jgi:hypothetical protein
MMGWRLTKDDICTCGSKRRANMGWLAESGLLICRVFQELTPLHGLKTRATATPFRIQRRLPTDHLSGDSK